MPHIRTEIKIRGKKPEYRVSSNFEPDRENSVIYMPKPVYVLDYLDSEILVLSF